MLQLIQEENPDFQVEELLEKFIGLKELCERIEPQLEQDSGPKNADKEKAFFTPELHREKFEARLGILHEIRDRISGLREGESFIFPGIWSYRCDLHAVLYEVVKRDTDSFDFTIFNTGAGSQFHVVGENNYRQSHVPLLTKEGVSSKRLCSLTFLSSILYRMRFDGASKDFETDSEFYEIALALLDGQYKNDYSWDKSSQKSGTCSFRVLLAYIQNYLGPGKAKPLLFQIKFWSLLKFYSQSKSKQTLSVEKLALLAEAKRGVNHAALKLYREVEEIGGDNQRDIALAFALLKQVEAFVEEQQKIVIKRAERPLPADPISFPELPSGSIFNFSDMKHSGKAEGSSGTMRLEAGKSYILNRESTRTLSESLAQALSNEELQSWELEKLIVQLPIPLSEQESKLYTSTGAKALSDQLRKLMQMYSSCISRESVQCERVFLNFFHIYALLHACCNGGFSTKKGNALFSQYGVEIPFFGVFFCKINANFSLVLKVSEDIKRRKQLIAYFDQANEGKQCRFFDYAFKRTESGRYQIHYKNGEWENCADFQFLSDYYKFSDPRAASVWQDVSAHYLVEDASRISKAASLSLLFTKHYPPLLNNLRTTFFEIIEEIEFLIREEPQTWLLNSGSKKFKEPDPDDWRVSELSFELRYEPEFEEDRCVTFDYFSPHSSDLPMREMISRHHLTSFGLSDQRSSLVREILFEPRKVQNYLLVAKEDRGDFYVQQRVREFLTAGMARFPLVLEFYLREYVLLQDPLHQKILYLILSDSKEFEEYVIGVEGSLEQLTEFFERITKIYHGDRDSFPLMLSMLQSMLLCYENCKSFSTSFDSQVQWQAFEERLFLLMQGIVDTLFERDMHASFETLFEYYNTFPFELDQDDYSKMGSLLLKAPYCTNPIGLANARASAYQRLSSFNDGKNDFAFLDAVFAHVDPLHKNEKIDWKGSFPSYTSSQGHVVNFLEGVYKLPFGWQKDFETIISSTSKKLQDVLRRREFAFDEESCSYKDLSNAFEIFENGSFCYTFEGEKYSRPQFQPEDKPLEVYQYFGKSEPAHSCPFLLFESQSKQKWLILKSGTPYAQIISDPSGSGVFCQMVENKLKLLFGKELPKNPVLEELIPNVAKYNWGCFIDEKGHVQKITLPYDLSFSFRNGFYYCDQYPDLFLSSQKTLKHPPFRYLEESFLILRDQDGQSYIISRHLVSYKMDMDSVALVAELKNSSFTQKKYFLFRIDPITGKIEAKSPEEHVYLVSLLIEDGQYFEALDLIYSIWDNKATGSKREDLQHAIHQLRKQVDQGNLPEHAAISLHLFILFDWSSSGPKNEKKELVKKYRNLLPSIPPELHVSNETFASLKGRYEFKTDDHTDVISGTTLETIVGEFSTEENIQRLPFLLSNDGIAKIDTIDDEVLEFAPIPNEQREGRFINRESSFTNGPWYGLFWEGLNEKLIERASILHTLLTAADLDVDNYLSDLIDLAISNNVEESLSARYILGYMLRYHECEAGESFFDACLTWEETPGQEQILVILFLITFLPEEKREPLAEGLSQYDLDTEKLCLLCTAIASEANLLKRALKDWKRINSFIGSLEGKREVLSSQLQHSLLPRITLQNPVSIDKDMFLSDKKRVSIGENLFKNEVENKSEEFLIQLREKYTLPAGTSIEEAILNHPLAGGLYKKTFTSLPDLLMEQESKWVWREGGIEHLPSAIDELKDLSANLWEEIERKISFFRDFRQHLLIQEGAAQATTSRGFNPALLRMARTRRREFFLREVAGGLLFGKEQFIKESGLSNPNDQENYYLGAIELIELASEADHVERCIHHLERGLAHISQHNPAELSERLGPILMAEHSFDTAQNPRKLAFEYLSGVLLRDNQAIKLDAILSAQNSHVVVKMLMGEGKTSVLIPYLSLMFAMEGYLPFLMVSHSLKSQGLKELRTLLGRRFQRLVFDFSFDRSSAMTPSAMRELHVRLVSLLSSGGIVVATPESVQSFLLSYLELFFLPAAKQAHLDTSEQMERAIVLGKMKQIIALLRQKGAALADESHVLFRSLQEVNYTLGDLHSIPKETQSLVLFLYQQLSQRGYNFASSPYAVKEQPMPWEEMVVELADSLVREFFTFHDVQTQKWVRNFLSGRSTELGLLENINSKAPDLADQIGLAYAHLLIFLPHSLEKIHGVEFGRAKDPFHRPFAVPYLGKERPSKRGEFGHLDVMLDLTARLYYLEGLTVSQFTDWLLRFKGLYINHIGINQEVIPNSWVGQMLQVFEEGFDPRKVDFSNHEELDALFKTCAKNPLIVGDYLKEILLPSYKQENQKISSTPSDLGDDLLFKKVITMSGTPFNKACYPHLLSSSEEGEVFESKADKVATARLTEALLRDSNSACFSIPDKESDQHFLRHIARMAKTENVRAVIDLAAFFRGVTNLEVAQELLRCIDDIESVVFYEDNSQEKVILQRGDVLPKKLEGASFPKAGRLAYFDQLHCFGADIPLEEGAHGVLSVPRNAPAHRLEQAAKRLRRIEKQQTLSTVITESFQEEMQKAFAKREIHTADLYLSSVAQEGKLVEQELLYATRQKLMFQMRRKFLDAHFDNLQVVIPEGLFINTLRQRPYELYCSPKEWKNPRDIFRQELERSAFQWTRYWWLNDDVYTKWNEIIDQACAILPDQILASARVDSSDLDLQIVKQVEVQAEVVEERTVKTGIAHFREEDISFHCLTSGVEASVNDSLMNPEAPYAFFSLNQVMQLLDPSLPSVIFKENIYVTRNFIRTAALEEPQLAIKIKPFDFVLEVNYSNGYCRYIVVSLAEANTLLGNKHVLQESMLQHETCLEVKISCSLMNKRGHVLMHLGSDLDAPSEMREVVGTTLQLLDGQVNFDRSRLEKLDATEQKQVLLSIFSALHANREIPTPLAAGNVYEYLCVQEEVDSQVVNARYRAQLEELNRDYKRSRIV